MPRAKALFEKQGLTVTLAGTGYTTGENQSIAQWLPDANALLKSSTAIKEYLGTLSTK
ncbi:hypothetical protein SHINM1_017770 [Fluviibacter phosphoraccumulans]|nr:hypothetical protein SHINM1_017770 [Fluviibacter phosphoraccumulans]